MFTPGVAAAELLTTKYAGKRVYVLGTDGMKEYLREEGIALDDERPEVCLLAFDSRVSFEKLKRFNEVLQTGCPISPRTPFPFAPRADFPCPT